MYQKLNEEEVKRYTSLFNVNDLDGSDDLDEEEFNLIAEKVIDQRLLPRAQIDANRDKYMVDGRLDLEAFLNVMACIKIERAAALKPLTVQPTSAVAARRRATEANASASAASPSAASAAPGSTVDAVNPPPTVDGGRFHAHQLKLRRKEGGAKFACDVCNETGAGFHYHCEQCRFDMHLRHLGYNEEAIRPAPTRAATGGNGKAVCKFWLGGYCRFGAQCRDEHDPQYAAQNVCPYNANKGCKAGATCPMLHADPSTAKPVVAKAKPISDPAAHARTCTPPAYHSPSPSPLPLPLPRPCFSYFFLSSSLSFSVL